MTYRYTAYGLSIESEMPLPELPASEFDVPDVVITLGGETAPLEEGTLRNAYHFDLKKARMSWTGVGAFEVTDGRSILVSPAPEVDASLLRLPLLGTVFGALLHQRGLGVLHAGAVHIEGKAIAFIGQKGAGKSTTVAALCARGHALLADDILALDLNRKDAPVAKPAFPRLKLWPDSVTAALKDDPENLPVMHQQVAKRSWRANDSFWDTALPLGGIYVLCGGEEVRIDAIPSQEAFMQLVRHSNSSQFMEDRTIANILFPRCRRIVRAVPVRRLMRTTSLDDLDALVDRIEADVSTLAAEAGPSGAGGDGSTAPHHVLDSVDKG